MLINKDKCRYQDPTVLLPATLLLQLTVQGISPSPVTWGPTVVVGWETTASLTPLSVPLPVISLPPLTAQLERLPVTWAHMLAVGLVISVCPLGLNVLQFATPRLPLNARLAR